MRHNNPNVPPFEITLATTDKEVVASFQHFLTENYPLPYQKVKVKPLPEGLPELEGPVGVSLLDRAYQTALHYSKYVKGPIIAFATGLWIGNLDGWPGMETEALVKDKENPLSDLIIEKMNDVPKWSRGAALSTGMVLRNVDPIPETLGCTWRDMTKIDSWSDRYAVFPVVEHEFGYIPTENRFPGSHTWESVWIPKKEGFRFDKTDTVAECTDDVTHDADTTPYPYFTCLVRVLSEVFSLRPDDVYDFCPEDYDD